MCSKECSFRSRKHFYGRYERADFDDETELFFDDRGQNSRGRETSRKRNKRIGTVNRIIGSVYKVTKSEDLPCGGLRFLSRTSRGTYSDSGKVGMKRRCKKSDIKNIAGTSRRG